MGRRIRMRKYSRRTSSNNRVSQVLIIIVAAVAFVVLSVALSVAAGLALGNLADNYENEGQKNGNLAVNDYYSGNKKVKAVDAHEYSWGIGTGYYISIGISDFSVCLRDADGFITYRSEVALPYGEVSDMGSRKLLDEVRAIHNEGGYVCTYFYSTAFDIEDEYERNIAKAYEVALINEAARGGVNEILIIGLAPTQENIGEMEAFVSELALAAQNSALGVLVSADDVKLTDSGVYLVPRLRAVCDFAALDMRDMPADAANEKNGEASSQLYTFLDDMEYYISSGSMRLVFSSENSSLAKSAVNYGATSIQIVK